MEKEKKTKTKKSTSTGGDKKVSKDVKKKPVSTNLEATIYNQKGKPVGKFELPESIFGLPWKGDLVHQVVTAMQANARTPVAHSRDRSEVSGGGKKPWKQKGTGRARHGSSRSPIWKGGGVTHGPRKEKDYSQKINRKMKAKALFTVLSEKYRKGQILFIEEISLKNIKTKDAVAVINDLSSVKGFEKITYGLAKGRASKKARTFITVPAKSNVLKKSFSNVPVVELDEIRNLNPVDLLAFRYIIISQPTESVAFLGGKLQK